MFEEAFGSGYSTYLVKSVLQKKKVKCFRNIIQRGKESLSQQVTNYLNSHICFKVCRNVRISLDHKSNYSKATLYIFKLKVHHWPHFSVHAVSYNNKINLESQSLKEGLTCALDY